MLFIDFPDAMGDQEVLNEFIKVQIPTMKQGLEELSYGQLTSTVDVVNKYFRLQKSIEYYNLLFQYNVINYATQGLPTDAKLQEFLKDVVELTDPQVDFSKYDFVSIITSNGSRLGLDGSVGFRFILDGKAFNFAHMSFSSTKEYFGNPDKATSLLHDVGHMMGIPHGWGGFPYGNANNPIINVPIWSLMATGGGSPNPDLLAWERFLLGWIDEKNVLCISEWKTSDFTIEIGRINQVDTKTKMVVIRLNKYEAIIIESPDDTVFDYVKTNSIRWKYDGSPGVIIYSLNTNILSNYGAFRLLYPSNTSERMDGRPWGLTKVNESVEIASRNIKIRVLKSDTKGQVIEVSKIES
jgi:M6 family metalloprotease-like protein